jgi:hypothetical protein
MSVIARLFGSADCLQHDLSLDHSLYCRRRCWALFAVNARGRMPATAAAPTRVRKSSGERTVQRYCRVMVLCVDSPELVRAVLQERVFKLAIIWQFVDHTAQPFRQTDWHVWSTRRVWV